MALRANMPLECAADEFLGLRFREPTTPLRVVAEADAEACAAACLADPRCKLGRMVGDACELHAAPKRPVDVACLAAPAPGFAAAQLRQPPRARDRRVVHLEVEASEGERTFDYAPLACGDGERVYYRFYESTLLTTRERDCERACVADERCAAFLEDGARCHLYADVRGRAIAMCGAPSAAPDARVSMHGKVGRRMRESAVRAATIVVPS